MRFILGLPTTFIKNVRLFENVAIKERSIPVEPATAWPEEIPNNEGRLAVSISVSVEEIRFTKRLGNSFLVIRNVLALGTEEGLKANVRIYLTICSCSCLTASNSSFIITILLDIMAFRGVSFKARRLIENIWLNENNG